MGHVGRSMGLFYSVRGWLEGDRAHLIRAREIIEENADQSPYVDSWVFQERGGGGTGYLFFGSEVRDVSLPAVLAQLQRLAEVCSEDGPHVDFLEGRFFAAPEDGSKEKSWSCSDGVLTPSDV